MLASTVTIKGQTTIPAEVRKALALHAGDKVVFEVIDHKAVISKIEPFDYAYHSALSQALNEWGSKEDDDAYENL